MRELEREASQTHTEQVGTETGLERLRLTVIGAGRAGGSIARAAGLAGLDVTSSGRDRLDAVAAEADVALVCVPDGEIEAVAARLAQAAPRLKFVGHVSGAVPLNALDETRRAGAESFGLHPLQTLPSPDSDVAGSACAVSGESPQALAYAFALAERLGMTPFELDDGQRAAYHAAAAIASNFLVALEESAVELMAAAGVSHASELLTPLVLRSAANWSERGADALTGPIARGDEATVERHLNAISETAPHLVPLYTALAQRTRELAGGRHGEAGR